MVYTIIFNAMTSNESKMYWQEFKMLNDEKQWTLHISSNNKNQLFYSWKHIWGWGSAYVFNTQLPVSSWGLPHFDSFHMGWNRGQNMQFLQGSGPSFVRISKKVSISLKPGQLDLCSQ